MDKNTNKVMLRKNYIFAIALCLFVLLFDFYTIFLVRSDARLLKGIALKADHVNFIYVKYVLSAFIMLI